MSDADLWQLTFTAAFYTLGIGAVGVYFKRGDLVMQALVCSVIVAVAEVVMQHRGITESYGMWPTAWFAIAAFLAMLVWHYLLEYAKEMVRKWDREGLPPIVKKKKKGE